MNDEFFNRKRGLDESVFHLPKRRSPRSNRDEQIHEMEMSIADHFREQNELLRTNNTELKQQLNRLTNGVERLVSEMHGVRTGVKEEAFARICGGDAGPDLPTVRGEAAFWYTHTAATIGVELGFHSSQIGTLLGIRGLNWVGNGDYQEIGRFAGKVSQKYWHQDVPMKLRKILDENCPSKYGINDKWVLIYSDYGRAERLSLPTSRYPPRIDAALNH